MATLDLQQPASELTKISSGQRGSGWRALLVLDLVFLTTAGIFICLAPAGNWQNQVMGVELWQNGDPAAGYTIGSLYAFTRKNRIFVGHPGTTLQLLVGGFARVIYAANQVAGGKERFFDFWARNLRGLFIIAALLTSAMHVVSFHLLYAFAKRLLRDASVAFVAVLAYATAFPVLFYAMRISPEPLLVIAFLTTILALWNLQENLEAGAHLKAQLWTAVAALASVGAIYTKIHLGGILPLFAVAQLLLQSGSMPEGILHRMLKRLVFLPTFFITAAAAGWLGKLRVNWHWFFRWWTLYAPGHTQIDVTQRYVVNTGPLQGLWIALKHNAAQWTPGITPAGLFVIADGLFTIIAVVGIIFYWKRNKPERRLIFWPLLYCALITPIVLYRGSWHYLFLHLAVGAVPLAMLIHHLAQRFISSATAQYAAAIVAVLLLHAASMVFFINGKLWDVRAYRSSTRIYLEALASLKPAQHVAIIDPGRDVPLIVFELTSKWVKGAQELDRSLTSLFVAVEDEQTLSPQFVQEHQIGPIIRHNSKNLRKNPALKRRLPGPAMDDDE